MMTSSDFEFLVDGNQAFIEDVFPEFNKNDRIGIIVSEDGGSTGASGLLMSAITKFYDFHRDNLGKKSNQLWIYPEFYVFHVDKYRLDHYWLDIWPPHKEVLVEDDPEQILEAINDRAITRLIVEDRKIVKGTFLRETLTSANHRIISALAYSPTGRVKEADVEIISCLAAERCIFNSIKRTKTIPENIRGQLKKQRKALHFGPSRKIKESYRIINPSDAFGMLTTNMKPAETTRKYLSYL